MITATHTTELTINGANFSPYATRDAHQTFLPIPAKLNQRRTVNGTLVDLSASQFAKYASVITCEDMEVPQLDGVFQGDVLTVGCMFELSYITASGSPGRSAVAGSVRTEGAYTYYRPEMTMMVTDFHYETNEWGAKVSWELDLEEV